MATKVSAFGVALFYISWIFLGNFILLNLFLAILLDSFLEEEEGEEDEQEQKLKAKAKRDRFLLRTKRQNVKKVFLGENNERKLMKKRNQPTIFTVAKADSDEDLEDLDEEQIINIFKEENMLKPDK